MADKPEELKNNSLNSWSHLNSDAPVLHKHGLKISRFQQSLDQYECGNCIQDKFTVNVGGKETNWELRIYPNGYEEETAGFLALFVKHKESSNCKYLIKSNICILDNQGQKRVHCELPGKVLSCKQMHGTKKYIQRDMLMGDNKIYHNDSVTFLLEAEICLPDTRVSFVEAPEDDSENMIIKENRDLDNDISLEMRSNFGNLLKSGAHSDVVIRCQDASFPCHKSILAARSPVFAAMFSHSMTENQNNEVKIEDLDSSTVHMMLQYIYSGHFQNNIGVEDLLQAADKYELSQLKSACELALSRTINLSNCLDYLILSDLYTALQLQKHCLQFTVQHLTKIMSTITWKTKLSNHPSMMALILQATAQQNERRHEGSSAKRMRKELTSFSSLFSSESSEGED